ncbi:hypothetical protein JOQ06_005174 [Pogonophryne albipinna]|uniref:Uncharacterized protein n=1 Tax=Pogonophryne albipinna TaxID=1090488 RepID=A0AAD6F3G4_9TELE|nr:hypothetical protein JOQ06_005174 [Pogonophryne albipinna]
MTCFLPFQTAVPWDMWSGEAQKAEPGADTGFVADWSADFGSANGDAAQGPKAPDVGPEGGADTATPPQDGGAATAGDEVSSWSFQSITDLPSSAVRTDEEETRQAVSEVDTAGQEDRRKSTPGLIFTNEFGEQIEDSTEDGGDRWSRSPDGSGSEYETAEEWGDGGADDDLSSEDRFPEGCEDRSQTVEQVSAGEERPGKPTDLTSIYIQHSEAQGAFDSVTSAEAHVAFDSVTSVEAQGGGAFDSVTSAEAQGGGAFDSVTSAEAQGGGAFDSVTSAETQGGGAFDSDPFVEAQGGGAFDSDPFAETQGGGAFDSVPFAEAQGGGAFDSVTSAEAQEGGAFDSGTFAETQGGGAFDSDPFTETQGGGAFYLVPFAETQGGGAFDSDTSAETQGGGAFDSDPFAETQGGGAFDSDPFAETQGGGAFDSDPFAETQGGGAFDSDPFAETQFGDKGGGFEFDPFAAETSGGLVSSGDGGGGWDTDPFAQSFPAASAGTEDPAAINPHSSLAVSGTAGGTQDLHITRIDKQPEHSDMSEDEAANRRIGKLYQALDTEKEEVFNFLLTSVW